MSKKKKLTHIDRYRRTSYGKEHWVKSHYRGHHHSKAIPGTDGKKYRAGGRVHAYSNERDKARHAKHTRKYNKAHWRGDREGFLI